jgi:hypothetical protein
VEAVNIRFPLFKHTSAGLAITGAAGNAFLDMIGDPFFIVTSLQPAATHTLAV